MEDEVLESLERVTICLESLGPDLDAFHYSEEHAAMKEARGIINKLKEES